jgi:uncharacterized protein (DUF779 family)
MPDPSALPALAASVDAVMLIIRLSARYGPLMFLHDANDEVLQPRCRPVGSLPLDEHDIKLGEVAGCEYWIAPPALDKLGASALRLDVLDESGDRSGLAGRFVLRKVDN